MYASCLITCDFCTSKEMCTTFYIVFVESVQFLSVTSGKSSFDKVVMKLVHNFYNINNIKALFPIFV